MSHGHTHADDHFHSHEKDPAEQEELARHIGEELSDLFVRYVRGEVDFADLTFATFDILQDLHVVALGEYELEYDEEELMEPEPGGTGSDYDLDTATAQQEELAQEPAER